MSDAAMTHLAAAAGAPQGPPRRGSPAAVALAAGIALLSAALLLLVVGDPVFAAAFVAGTAGAGAVLLLRSRPAAPFAGDEVSARPDLSLIRAALDTCSAAVAITDSSDALICANERYAEWLGSWAAPDQLTAAEDVSERLKQAGLAARRDGSVRLESLAIANMMLDVDVSREGFDQSHLVWKFSRAGTTDLAVEAKRMLAGQAGQRLGEAGVMAALADPEGNLLAANDVFVARALGGSRAALAGVSLVSLLTTTEEGQFRFATEGKTAPPLRIIQVAVGGGRSPPTLFMLFDDTVGAYRHLDKEESANLNALLDILPLGLALVNVDGRFVYLNKAFRKSAGLSKEDKPVYPGDLLVTEDKAAVSNLVHRFARGPSSSSDIAVRLKAKSEEPVALTVAGVRGLGEAAVLLSIKDNSEEDRLKRQVAQATKMQAVGQLAGGVAHDFNNILTAIIGYCDLMLMRHTPGDSDYDDIQQIRSNSNRAAGLTRQLLAFSRQQTLRPQIVQLPDVISEVSNLLKRLLGETVRLQVKHGRNLGPVRADPGQLEQVIINLAVNARDAMPDGGTLTLQTYAVSTDDVRQMASDILPIAEYTALRVSDTGVGIPANLLGKIFEPFFTTKEVGKGTGLGLSTVYGIVKQSGGFIFANSELRKGTSFTIYLPVHRAEAGRNAVKEKVKEANGELWGSETILLVEDEAMVRAVAERALTRHGYTVLTAENGEAALEILEREEKVDLMISDVVMPSMDGPTAVRAARKMHPDLPILFISGYAEEQLRQSIDLEKVAFLAKPFSVQKLAEAARDALQSK